MMERKTAPGTLIAVPSLRDPNFANAVVVMLAHTEEGAVGIVVNHPTPFHNAEILKQLGQRWHGPEAALLMRGGPVDPDGFWMFHDGSLALDDAVEAAPGVFASRSRDALERLCAAQTLPLLLGVGCAGWGPGQLEQELAAGAWLLGPTHRELVFAWPRDEVWERVLREMGINPALIGDAQLSFGGGKSDDEGELLN